MPFACLIKHNPQHLTYGVACCDGVFCCYDDAGVPSGGVFCFDGEEVSGGELSDVEEVSGVLGVSGDEWVSRRGACLLDWASGRAYAAWH